MGEVQLLKNDLKSEIWMISIRLIRKRISKIMEALSEIIGKF